MTPKEKAEELFKKYSVYNLDNGEQWYVANKFAKQCALIAVEELIKETGAKYWYDVKQEIQEL